MCFSDSHNQDLDSVFWFFSPSPCLAQLLLTYELMPTISPFYSVFFLPLPNMHSFNKNLFLYIINNSNIYWVLISCESNIVLIHIHQWNLFRIPEELTVWWGRDGNKNRKILPCLVYQGRLHSRGDHFAGSQRMDKSSPGRQGRETSMGTGNSMNTDTEVDSSSPLYPVAIEQGIRPLLHLNSSLE